MAHCQSTSYHINPYHSAVKTSAKVRAWLQFKLGRLLGEIPDREVLNLGQAAEVHCQTRPTKSWTPSLLAPVESPRRHLVMVASMLRVAALPPPCTLSDDSLLVVIHIIYIYTQYIHLK